MEKCMASPLGTHLSSVNSLFAQNIKCIENVSVFTVYQSLSKCKSCEDCGLHLYDTTLCALGRGSRRENTVCDLRRWLEDGVQEAVHCSRKQVMTNVYRM